ncbi:MAG: hypothetical protein R2774_12385 [Saprospiraceae bacterium]
MFQRTTLFFFLLQFCCTQLSFSNDLVVSRIDKQEMFINSKIVVYFSSLAYLDSAEISSQNLPDFGEIVNDGHGAGRIIFNANEDDIGEYNINITVTNKSYSNTQFFTLVVHAIPDDAKIYYVDPVNGLNSNQGNKDAPWQNLQGILDASAQLIQPNSIVFLKSGDHGQLNFWAQNSEKVFILAEKDQFPTCKSVTFSVTNNWVLQGISISPEFSGTYNNLPLIRVFGGCDNIVISNCLIQAFEKQEKWSTNAEWYAFSGNGIISTGSNCVFTSNMIRNTWFSVELKSDNQKFSYNIIDGFGADAVRALANNITVEFNQIKNATVFDYDDPIRPQHDDIFQSWTFSAPIKNCVVRNNQVCDHSNPNLRLPSEITQGIVIFDGFAEDWTIENNLVVLHHAHGIALYGAKNCKVVNNTVVKNPFQKFNTSLQPWIRINPTKQTAGAKESFGNLVQNNIAHSYQSDNLQPATLKTNSFGFNANQIFSDYFGWDFKLKSTSNLNNKGTLEDAPTNDLYNLSRRNAAIDLGCFEDDALFHQDAIVEQSGDIEILEIGLNYCKFVLNISDSIPFFKSYKITYNDKIVYVKDSIVELYNLDLDTDYSLSASVVNDFNSESNVFSSTTFKTLDIKPNSQNLICITAENDVEINASKNLMWGRSPFIRVGALLNGMSQCGIIPFKVPYMPSNMSIVNADFITFLSDKSNIDLQSLDLYGLPTLTEIYPSKQFYYEGASFQDEKNVLISHKYTTSGVDNNSWITLDSTERQIFATYISDQIDAGLALGDYLFFRMNLTEKYSSDNTFFEFVSSDNFITTQVPKVCLTLMPTSSVKNLKRLEKYLSIHPSPSDGHDLNLKVEMDKIHFDLEITIYSSSGQYLDRRIIKSTEKSTIVDLSHLRLTSGQYFLMASADHGIGTLTFIIY